MGANCHLSLSPNVRVQDVASVLGILFGLPFGLERVNGYVVVCRVRGANVRGFEDHPEMVRIGLEKPNGDTVAGFYYYFENRGGRRLLSSRVRAEVIAAFVKTADFFGGVVDFCDCDAKDVDHAVPDRSDDENHAEDGEPWNAFQRRMAEVRPLTKKDILAFKKYATY